MIALVSWSLHRLSSVFMAATSWLLWPVLVGASVLGMYWATQHQIAGIGVAAALQILVVAIVFPLERWMPEHALWNRPRGDVLTDALHAMVSGIFVTTLIRLFVFRFLPSLSLWPVTLPMAMQLVLALVVAEVGAFAMHVGFHRSRGLWPFHAVHHSATRLYWLNSSRSHPFDTATTVLVSLTPLALLGAPKDVLSLFDAFVVSHITLQHSNIRLRHGWMNHLVATAEFHRWHHAAKANEGSQNYASFLSLFDHIFGTFRMSGRAPAADALGLQDGTVVLPTWWAQLCAPLQRVSLFKRPR